MIAPYIMVISIQSDKNKDDWWQRQQDRMNRAFKTRRIVYFVPCGAKKLDRRAKARDLYVGSMFQSALRSAEAQGDGEIFILSALHGILRPDDIVEPYNMKMGDDGSVDSNVLQRQAKKLGIDSKTDVYTFLPKAYFRALDKALKPLGVYAQDIYEAAPGIGVPARCMPYRARLSKV